MNQSKKGAVGVIPAILLLCIGAYGGTAYAAGPPERLTVTSEVMFGDSDDFVPEDIHEEDGNLYRLQSWEMEPVEIGPHQEEVKQQVLYEAMEDRSAVPDNCDITAEDDATKQSITGEFPIQDWKEENARWADDFVFPVVFHAYGAEYYQLGERTVPLDVAQPALADCETELLEEIGVSADGYRIREIVWDGTPYYDENGVLCRNAKASGEKKVADYLVTYGGTVTFPRIQGYRCQAVYELPKIMQEPAAEKIILPKNVQEPIPKPAPETVLEQETDRLITRQAVVITLSLLFVVLILLSVSWAIRKIVENMKKKKKERGQCYGTAGEDKAWAKE